MRSRSVFARARCARQRVSCRQHAVFVCVCVSLLLLLDGVFCLAALLFLFLVMRRLAAAAATASLFSLCCGSAAGGWFATWSLRSDLISTCSTHVVVCFSVCLCVAFISNCDARRGDEGRSTRSTFLAMALFTPGSMQYKHIEIDRKAFLCVI